MMKRTDGNLPAVTDNNRPRVFELRGMHVMLASDVAGVFGVETRQVVQNIKRNPNKFPERYAFEVTGDEHAGLRSLGVISKSGRGGSRAFPWVVTQKGAIRLATVMDAPKAIEATDIFIDVFTEVLTQIYKGKSEVEISNPSRIAPDREAVQKIQSRIAKAVNNLLDTMFDTERKTTVRDELGEVAVESAKHIKAWLKAKAVENEKLQAETLLILEKVRDLSERRQSDLQGAALDRERKALENIEMKIKLVERLIKMKDQLEPNAVVGVLPNFTRTPLQIGEPEKALGRKKKGD